MEFIELQDSNAASLLNKSTVEVEIVDGANSRIWYNCISSIVVITSDRILSAKSRLRF